MEISRRFRGSARRIMAALSDEVKDQIRQKVHELLDSGDGGQTPPAEAGEAPIPSDDGGAELSAPPSDEEATGEDSGAGDFGVGDDGGQTGGDGGDDADAQFSNDVNGQDEATTDEGSDAGGQPSEGGDDFDFGGFDMGDWEGGQEDSGEEGGAVDMPQGNDDMSNADEGAQEDLSPTSEESFDDDGTDGAFDEGNDFTYDDFSLDGNFDDSSADEDFPELKPPKSRRQQSQDFSNQPDEAETGNDFGNAGSKAERPMPKVKDPTKNTKVPTLHDSSPTSDDDMKMTSAFRRGRFDTYNKYAARGMQVKRKNRDTMPDKDTKFSPRRDPPVRAPKKVTRDTVQTSKSKDKDIGRDPDKRKD